MRVLVCGDRNWRDNNLVTAVLTGLYEESTIGHLVAHMAEFVLIEGGAKGADAAAAWWADASPMHSHNEHPDDPRFEHQCYEADWKAHGRAAGPIRNQLMLKQGKPDLVIAFHDNLAESKGTSDMIHRARIVGVEVWHISHGPQQDLNLEEQISALKATLLVMQTQLEKR